MNYSDIQISSSIDFNTTNKPYLIKNYAKDWYACKNWSFEYLKNLDSNLPVNAIIGNATSGEKEAVSIKFKDYIANIISNDTNAYLTTFYLFKKFPNLKKHIEYQNIKDNSLICHLLGWIGPSGTITGFHADWSENINVQIKGKKIFYLVSPEYNKYMYINERFERISATSLVELKNFDETKFPLFKKAKLIKVILEDGDAIYIPRGWWHYVESLAPSISVSVHFWRLGSFFKDLVPESAKVFLHDIGLYKKNNCSCHTYNNEGKRIKRG